MRELWNSIVITAIAMCLWTALYFLLVRPANQPVPAPTPSPTPTSPCITLAPQRGDTLHYFYTRSSIDGDLATQSPVILGVDKDGKIHVMPFYPIKDNDINHTLPSFKK